MGPSVAVTHSLAADLLQRPTLPSPVSVEDRKGLLYCCYIVVICFIL